MTNTRSSASEMVRRATEGLCAFEPREVARHLAAGESVLVDVREHPEIHTGVIPGAIHVPRGVLEFVADPASQSHDARLDPDRGVIVYCASGGRSALAAATLAELGYQNVAHLDGGIVSWAGAGFELAGAMHQGVPA